VLVDPVLGTELARVSSAGVGYDQALQYARGVGGPTLRALTYGERAALLGRIADVLTAHRDEYFRFSLENSSATTADAAFDVDGAIYTLKYQACQDARREPTKRIGPRGPVVSKAQQRAVMAGRARLMQDATALYGGDGVRLVDADPSVAAFVPPTLLGCEDALRAESVHDFEVFGAVATLMPYNDLNHAVQIAERGGGSLVASIYTADTSIGQAMAEGLAPSQGRVNIVSGQLGKHYRSRQCVMPHSLHGGPGRAGNGQELGGLRAWLYHQLVVWQGHALGRIERGSRATTLIRDDAIYIH